MTEYHDEFLPIDLRLRFVLFGLECALGVPMSAPECERVFRDAHDDRVSARAYVFHEGPRLRALGFVDEYEADSIRLRVEGGRGVAAATARIIECSESHAFRLRRALEEGPRVEPPHAGPTDFT